MSHRPNFRELARQHRREARRQNEERSEAALLEHYRMACQTGDVRLWPRVLANHARHLERTRLPRIAAPYGMGGSIRRQDAPLAAAALLAGTVGEPRNRYTGLPGWLAR